MKDVEVLLQALPYIRRHRQKTFFLKFGGALVEDAESLDKLAGDLALLHNVGIRICVVHGGGPQATAMASRLGLQTRLVEGRRVTDADTLEVAKMVFAGKINLEAVGALRRHGLDAVGLSGVSAGIIKATRRAPTEMTDPDTGEKRMVDMGHVGDVSSVQTRLLSELMDGGHVPVVSSLAGDPDGNVLNINADTVATQLAIDLKADKLLTLTNVDGIMRDPKDPSTLISRITASEIEDEIAAGTIAAGMIPKARNAVEALQGGVPRVHILNGHEPHRLLVELFTREGAGTLITGDDSEEQAQSQR